MSSRTRDRKELGFFEHLEELRTRIIRSVIYISLGGAAGWAYRVPLLAFLRHPAEEGARRVGVTELAFRVFEPAAGFMIAIQISLLAGVVLAVPLIIWEIWRFIEPALESHERRWAVVLVPAAVLLFVGGVAFCWWVSPAAFAFLFRMDQSLGVQIERTLQPYLWFVMRMMLAFGVCFELPLVLMFLGAIGVVTSKQLLSWWRYAVVIICAAAAIITPTVDPVNMTILAAPMVALYFLSIALVRMVQRARPPAEEAEAVVEDPSVAVYEAAREGAEEGEGADARIPPPPGPE
jgi:sec-independent protein translocase protein TatC